jgi:UDP-N-acetylmuramate dehydrogenase
MLTKKEYIPFSEIKSKKYLIELKKIITIFVIIIFFIVFLYIRNIKNNLIYNLPILSKKTDNINKFDVKLLNELKNILKDEEIIENEIMSRHTTFKIGGPAQYFVKPRSIDKILCMKKST